MLLHCQNRIEHILNITQVEQMTYEDHTWLLFADSISKLSYGFLWKSGHAHQIFSFNKICRWLLFALCFGSGWKGRAYSIPYSTRPRFAEYTIGIYFEIAKNTKAFECFFTGIHRSLWKFSTTRNLYSLKSWLWFAVVVCVVRWPISNALLNDIWLACFTRMCNWKKLLTQTLWVYGQLDPWSFRPLSTRTFSIRSLVNSHLYCTQVNSILSIFRSIFVY